MSFSESYLGKLRAKVGSGTILVPGARVIVRRDDGHLLMQHRSDFDVWGIPGGNAEEGEDLQSIAIRETLEETGIRIWNLLPFGFGSDPTFETVTFPNGDVCQFFAMMFYTSNYDGTPIVADDESKAVEWINPNTLPVMLPNMRRSIEAFQRFERTGVFQMI
ncbi:NUDIX domain-containing protein [Agrobacterium tumefaciens]|uniref:NUDIX domain-containing protein n=1 Tax=Agrobacterium tumefaciens TaxID=358 RepID=UPI003BA0B798